MMPALQVLVLTQLKQCERGETSWRSTGFLLVVLTLTGQEVNGDKHGGQALTCLWLRGKSALRHTYTLEGQKGE